MSDFQTRELAALLNQKDADPTTSLKVRRGLVTAMAADSVTVRIGGVEVPGVPLYRGMTVRVNEAVDVLFDGPAPRIIGVIGGPSVPAPMYFTHGVVNQSPTSLTSLWENTSIATPQVPYVMDIDVQAFHGYTMTNNEVIFGLADETGANNILHKGAAMTAAGDVVVYQVGGWRMGTAFRGRKEYAAGQTCGAKIWYRITTGNIYCDLSIKVSFAAL